MSGETPEEMDDTYLTEDGYLTGRPPTVRSHPGASHPHGRED